MAHTGEWSSTEQDFSERLEHLVTEVLVTKFGFREVDRTVVDSGENLPYYAIAQPTPQEDENEATDKWLWSPEQIKWIRIDITASTNRRHIDYKEQKAQRYGVKVVRFNEETLENATRGSRRHLIIVAGLIDRAFNTSETIIG